MSALTEWVERLNAASVDGSVVQEAELAVLGADEATEDPVLAEARAQKAALQWLKNQLTADLRFNHRFRERTDVTWLDKVLAVARLQELGRVRIVKRSRAGGLRYDVSDLAATFHGRRILDSLGIGKRKMLLDKDEFARLGEATARIKLTLPEIVEPTTTERFFALSAGSDPTEGA